MKINTRIEIITYVLMESTTLLTSPRLLRSDFIFLSGMSMPLFFMAPKSCSIGTLKGTISATKDKWATCLTLFETSPFLGTNLCSSF